MYCSVVDSQLLIQGFEFSFWCYFSASDSLMKLSYFFNLLFFSKFVSLFSLWTVLLNIRWTFSSCSFVCFCQWCLLCPASLVIISGSLCSLRVVVSLLFCWFSVLGLHFWCRPRCSLRASSSFEDTRTVRHSSSTRNVEHHRALCFSAFVCLSSLTENCSHSLSILIKTICTLVFLLFRRRWRRSFMTTYSVKKSTNTHKKRETDRLLFS